MFQYTTTGNQLAIPFLVFDTDALIDKTAGNGRMRAGSDVARQFGLATSIPTSHLAGATVTDLVGQTLNQYRIVEKIREGGMATVYKAYHPSLDRYVAVKVLSPVHVDDPDFSQRFQREAQAVAQLEHRNILPLYDSGQSGAHRFIVMRYVEGSRTLTDVMATPLSLGQMANLIEQIGAALDHAHARGIIHRDVKPGNVLLDGDWVLLTDFGLAKVLNASMRLTSSGVGVGTLAYMSPEQAQALPIDHRADIYSLGVILFEMLTGKIPHDAESPFGIAFRRMSEPLPTPRSINPETPQGVERVVLKALASDPADRFETAGKMARALTRACAANAATRPLDPRSLLPRQEHKG